MNCDARGVLRCAYVDEDVAGTGIDVSEGIARMAQDSIPALL